MSVTCSNCKKYGHNKSSCNISLKAKKHDLKLLEDIKQEEAEGLITISRMSKLLNLNKETEKKLYKLASKKKWKVIKRYTTKNNYVAKLRPMRYYNMLVNMRSKREDKSIEKVIDFLLK